MHMLKNHLVFLPQITRVSTFDNDLDHITDSPLICSFRGLGGAKNSWFYSRQGWS